MSWVHNRLRELALATGSMPTAKREYVWRRVLSELRDPTPRFGSGWARLFHAGLAMAVGMLFVASLPPVYFGQQRADEPLSAPYVDPAPRLERLPAEQTLYEVGFSTDFRLVAENPQLELHVDPKQGDLVVRDKRNHWLFQSSPNPRDIQSELSDATLSMLGAQWVVHLTDRHGLTQERVVLGEGAEYYYDADGIRARFNLPFEAGRFDVTFTLTKTALEVRFQHQGRAESAHRVQAVEVLPFLAARGFSSASLDMYQWSPDPSAERVAFAMLSKDAGFAAVADTEGQEGASVGVGWLDVGSGRAYPIFHGADSGRVRYTFVPGGAGSHAGTIDEHSTESRLNEILQALAPVVNG